MIHNKLRIGNFTSSEISRLMSKGKGEMFGKGAKTYIQEKNIERKLGRSLNDIGTAKPMIWGNVVEPIAFDLLGLNYRLNSKETDVHPEYPFWCGSSDGDNPDTVIDIKCPFTVKSFAIFSDCETIEDVRNNHDSGDDYYWQLVSNAIILNKKFAELIVYCPYKSELDKIRESCEDFDGNPNKVAWIAFAEDDDLPYILDGGYYKNLKIIRFEVPEADKKELTERVIEAGKLLIK